MTELHNATGAPRDLLNEAELAKIREDWGRIETVDPCLPTYPKICAFLDSLSDARLMQIREAKIKFLSALASNRCYKRGLLAPIKIEADAP